MPLDYADPEGRTMRLAVMRLPACGPDPIGSLVLNPGGPGGSGLFAAAAKGLPAPTPPITIIGVQALFTPEFVVEIEATAVLD